MRPLRIYSLTFVRGATSLVLAAEGRTPCAARRAAYEALERRIKREHLPPDGWRLMRQQFETTIQEPSR